MLDDLERQHGVEALAGLGDRFGGGDAIVDRKTRRFGMGPRGADCFGACIDTGHGKAQARHRFGDKAAAAADVEHGEPVEWPQREGIRDQNEPSDVGG